MLPLAILRGRAAGDGMLHQVVGISSDGIYVDVFSLGQSAWCALARPDSVVQTRRAERLIYRGQSPTGPRAENVVVQ